MNLLRRRRVGYMSVIEEEWRRKVGYLSILFRENGHLTKKLPWKLGQMSIGGMSANRRRRTRRRRRRRRELHRAPKIPPEANSS